MKKFFSLFIFFLNGAACFGQSGNPVDEHLQTTYEVKNKTEKTLTINMSDYSILTFESLKEELISWKEKVKSAEINETTRQFILIHLPLLESRELFDVLNKYGIKKTDIISYK